MDATPILVKPAHLPALSAVPGEGRARLIFLTVPLISAAILAPVLVLSGAPVLVVALWFVAGIAMFVYVYRKALSQRAAETKVMAGELPLVTAHEVNGELLLRTYLTMRPHDGLRLRSGGTVRVRIEELRNPRGKGKRLGMMSWTFATTAKSITMTTRFDPTEDLLRDMTRRLKAINITAEITHLPYAPDAP